LFSVDWGPLTSGQLGITSLPRAARFPILNCMEVRFTPEQEAELAQIASTAGTDPEKLVQEAALRLVQEDHRFRAAVREGIAQADRGEFIEETEMDARLEQMLRS
jgi:predicted transcriptional regulator